MMLGATPRPDWLEPDWLLGQFGGTRKTAINATIDFVRAGVGLDSLWSETRNQAFLGSEGFVESMLPKLPDGDLREIPRLQRRGPSKPLDEYTKEHERNIATTKAYRSGDHTMKQIANQFGVHYATVSRILTMYQAQLVLINGDLVARCCASLPVGMVAKMPGR